MPFRLDDYDSNIVVPLRHVEIIEQELNGEAILFDPQSNDTHHLNRTAFQIWSLCDGKRSTREIAEHQHADFEVDFRIAIDHVEQVVIRLTEAGLLVLSIRK